MLTAECLLLNKTGKHWNNAELPPSLEACATKLTTDG
ncbi:hypothetical protein LYNGBM3L_46070 [Moorena producens 3L]|uniref:Uncharacterized protein n=1 Tax=Moorena producens 3L TaxID=489825 RepID=F4XX73_9CYAN|nr:hypothetical protein LYNGBM3L_46070 [Moorena producens 3L]